MVPDASQKRIYNAIEIIENAKLRTRAIGRKLRDVQKLLAEASAALMPLALDEEDGEIGARDAMRTAHAHETPPADNR